MAALIADATGLEPELIPGRRGEFTVWVGDRQVAQKDSGGFPAEPDVVAAVRAALGGQPPPR